MMFKDLRGLVIDDAVSHTVFGIDFLFSIAETEKIEEVEKTLINIIKERKNIEMEEREKR